MFCPVCRDEYRRGFTRCATCDVDLVETLDAEPAADLPERPHKEARIADLPAVNFCGFVHLEDAREARARLKEHGVRSEILIRDGEDDGQAEEYWLRVTPRDFPVTQKVLGYDEVASSASEDAADAFCSACGEPVSEDAVSCPHCGERFEES